MKRWWVVFRNADGAITWGYGTAYSSRAAAAMQSGQCGFLLSSRETVDVVKMTKRALQAEIAKTKEAIPPPTPRDQELWEQFG